MFRTQYSKSPPSRSPFIDEFAQKSGYTKHYKQSTGYRERVTSFNNCNTSLTSTNTQLSVGVVPVCLLPPIDPLDLLTALKKYLVRKGSVPACFDTSKGEATADFVPGHSVESSEYSRLCHFMLPRQYVTVDIDPLMLMDFNPQLGNLVLRRPCEFNRLLCPYLPSGCTLAMHTKSLCSVPMHALVVFFFSLYFFPFEVVNMVLKAASHRFLCS